MVNYELIVYCRPPHTRYTRYTRRARYEWYPSPSEVYGIIRKLRHEAKSDGIVEVVKIRAVTLTRRETTNYENLQLNTESEDRLI